MRSPQDVPRQRGRGITRGRIWVVVGIIVLFLLLTSLRGIAVFYTDYLWFSSVHLTTVWKGVLGTKIGLAVVFCAIFFAGMWASLAIADRIVRRHNGELRISSEPGIGTSVDVLLQTSAT